MALALSTTCLPRKLAELQWTGTSHLTSKSLNASVMGGRHSPNWPSLSWVSWPYFSLQSESLPGFLTEWLYDLVLSLISKHLPFALELYLQLISAMDSLWLGLHQNGGLLLGPWSVPTCPTFLVLFMLLLPPLFPVMAPNAPLRPTVALQVKDCPLSFLHLPTKCPLELQVRQPKVS